MNKQEAKAELERIYKEESLHLAKLLAKRKELQSIIDAPESGWFVPERSAYYYFISSSNHAYTRNINDMDERVFERQKVFRTEAEAKREDDKRVATIKYLRKIAELNQGWKPDWGNERQHKYLAVKNADNIFIEDFCTTKHKDNDWYSVSKEAAQEAVDSLTETEIDLIFKS